MIDKKDAKWWVLEVQKHPESAPDLIRMLADRLALLDRQNEELRGELSTLKRKMRGSGADAEIAELRQRIRELENTLHTEPSGRRLLIYARDRIEVNTAIDGVLQSQSSIGRTLQPDVRMLTSVPGTSLYAITDESRIFALSLRDLPVPPDANTPAELGNPRNVATILEQSAFETYRFLALLSERGYVYSVLAGSLPQLARRGDKLVRNLIPGDPILSAVPSHNADLLAVSRRGRWIRFPERAVGGAGSLVMDLPKGDTLAGMIPLNADTTLIMVTADGRIYARRTENLPTRKEPGKSAGMLIKSGTVAGICALTGGLLVLTNTGRLLTVEKIPSRATDEEGISISGLAENEIIFSVLTKPNTKI
jgi:DNA gyrase/topoisomerase IV subunit A